ncbi:MAG: hypothetical protein VW600_01445 [Ferrovibrio sp.]
MTEKSKEPQLSLLEIVEFEVAFDPSVRAKEFTAWLLRHVWSGSLDEAMLRGSPPRIRRNLIAFLLRAPGTRIAFTSHSAGVAFAFRQNNDGQPEYLNQYKIITSGKNYATVELNPDLFHDTAAIDQACRELAEVPLHFYGGPAEALLKDIHVRRGDYASFCRAHDRGPLKFWATQRVAALSSEDTAARERCKILVKMPGMNRSRLTEILKREFPSLNNHRIDLMWKDLAGDLRLPGRRPGVSS